jgi:hypothetical protein
MLFEKRLREGIHAGTTTVAFRRWKRPQVAVGGSYRTGLDTIRMVAVDVVQPAAVTGDDARRAGFESPQALLAGLRGDPQAPLFRLEFERTRFEPSARELLAAEDRLSAPDVEGIDGRLDRLDAAAGSPWTRATLRLIREQPATRAADLAPQVGMEKAPFKENVRKLKRLGLTISLEKGYRLSPRGEAFLHISSARTPDGP